MFETKRNVGDFWEMIYICWEHSSRGSGQLFRGDGSDLQAGLLIHEVKTFDADIKGELDSGLVGTRNPKSSHSCVASEAVGGEVWSCCLLHLAAGHLCTLVLSTSSLLSALYDQWTAPVLQERLCARRNNISLFLSLVSSAVYNLQQPIYPGLRFSRSQVMKHICIDNK